MDPNFVLWCVASLAIGLGSFLPVYLASTGRVGRNNWAGLRIAPLTENDARWRAGHRGALSWASAILIDSIVGVVVGLVFLGMGWSEARAQMAPIATFVMGVLGMIPMLVFAVRAARRVSPQR